MCYSRHLLHFCPSWERDPSHVALSEVFMFFCPFKKGFLLVLCPHSCWGLRAEGTTQRLVNMGNTKSNLIDSLKRTERFTFSSEACCSCTRTSLYMITHLSDSDLGLCQDQDMFTAKLSSHLYDRFVGGGSWRSVGGDTLCCLKEGEITSQLPHDQHSTIQSVDIINNVDYADASPRP